MSVRWNSGTKILLAIASSAAVVAALYFIFVAAFPYFYAESGSARYAREHRGEAILQVLAAGALLVIAGLCIRYSLSRRTWMIIVGVLAAFALVRCGTDYTRTPEHIQAVGGNWHVAVVHEPQEIDTVRYRLFYKRGWRYQSVESLAAEYHFLPPDCLTFRGLKVVGRPVYAMCGYRAPVESYDTTISETELLAKARRRPRFRTDWESIR